MQCKQSIILISCAVLLFSSCIKQVQVETRNAPKNLVVEGGISTDTVPYTVKLTYSNGLVNGEDIPDANLVKDAKVTITDDLGNATLLSYTTNGIYETTDPAYIGQEGRSYSITIEMAGGKKYISVPEKIKPAVPIDKINVEYVEEFTPDLPTYVTIHTDTKDPADQDNYYKWDYYTWMPRKAKGVGCGFGCIMYEYCFQKFVGTNLNIMSDESINGNEIKDNYIGNSYAYWYGKHYIDIAQLSISREYYQFLQHYKEQTTRTGSILDPLPSSIKGNVVNSGDPTDFALGYFSATSVTRRKAILVLFNLTSYIIDLSARPFIPEPPGACFELIPNTLPYGPSPAPQDPPPPGWETAEEIDVHW